MRRECERLRQEAEDNLCSRTVIDTRNRSIREACEREAEAAVARAFEEGMRQGTSRNDQASSQSRGGRTPGTRAGSPLAAVKATIEWIATRVVDRLSRAPVVATATTLLQTPTHRNG